LCDELLAESGQGAVREELSAAARYVRRRRFGAGHVDPGERADRRTKELAALARAGFGYDVATRVLDAPGRDDLHALELGADAAG
jgi:regulatory protein